MSTKDYSTIQETAVSDYLGWFRVSGSGAVACRPGDIISAEWLGECKTHTESGHKIVFYQSVWNKIAEEAIFKYRFPVLIVDDGSQRIDHTWCMIPRYIASNIADDKQVCITSCISTQSTKNFSFEHRTALKAYETTQRTSNCHIVVATATLGGAEVGVLPLSVFKELIE